MTPGIMIGTLLSTALTVGAVAQSTGGQTPSQTGSFENLQFTATGCLQSVEAAGTTQTGGASAAGAAGSGASRGGGFVLTNAKMGTGAKSEAAGASSTGPALSGSRESMTRFKLEGSASDLQKYADSLVEVTGKLDKNPSASSATGTATTGATGAAGPTGSGSAATGNAVTSQQEMPTLRVSRVRQVSATCSS